MFNSKIILVGQGAGGKDYLKRKLQARGFKYAPSLTTRLPRTGEVQGKDMVFVSKSEFEGCINAGMFLEYVEFNGNYYGTTTAQFDKHNLFIMTADAVSKIPVEFRKQCFVIFLNIDEAIREKRLNQRGMPIQDVLRRLEVDRKLFENFEDYDLMVTNPDF